MPDTIAQLHFLTFLQEVGSCVTKCRKHTWTRTLRPCLAPLGLPRASPWVQRGWVFGPPRDFTASPPPPTPTPALQTSRPEPLRPPRPQAEMGSAERTAFSEVSEVTRPQGGTERHFCPGWKRVPSLERDRRHERGPVTERSPLTTVRAQGHTGAFAMRGTLLGTLP